MAAMDDQAVLEKLADLLEEWAQREDDDIPDDADRVTRLKRRATCRRILSRADDARKPAHTPDYLLAMWDAEARNAEFAAEKVSAHDAPDFRRAATIYRTCASHLRGLLAARGVGERAGRMDCDRPPEPEGGGEAITPEALGWPTKPDGTLDILKLPDEPEPEPRPSWWARLWGKG